MSSSFGYHASVGGTSKKPNLNLCFSTDSQVGLNDAQLRLLMLKFPRTVEYSVVHMRAHAAFLRSTGVPAHVLGKVGACPLLLAQAACPDAACLALAFASGGGGRYGSCLSSTWQVNPHLRLAGRMLQMDWHIVLGGTAVIHTGVGWLQVVLGCPALLTSLGLEATLRPRAQFLCDTLDVPAAELGLVIMRCAAWPRSHDWNTIV